MQFIYASIAIYENLIYEIYLIRKFPDLQYNVTAALWYPQYIKVYCKHVLLQIVTNILWTRTSYSVILCCLDPTDHDPTLEAVGKY